MRSYPYPKSAPAGRQGLLCKIVALAIITLSLFAALLAPTATPDAWAQAAPLVVNTWAIDMHGNGSQMVVKQVELFESHTVVRFDVTNGRDFDTRFNASTRDTRLVDDQGRTYDLFETFTATVEPGDISTISLSFEPMPRSTKSVSFFFRDRNDDDNDVGEGFPGFQIDDIDLTNDVAAPVLPGDAVVDESENHPNGATLTIGTVVFEERGIKVGFEVINLSGRRIDLSNGRHASYIEDDLGNRYWLKLTDDEVFLPLDDNTRVDGTLAFAGRIHPTATSIELVMNHDESLTNERSTRPKFAFGPIEVAAGEKKTATGDILPIQIDETQRHATGLVLTVERLEFIEGGTGLVFQADNRDNGLVFLNGCCGDFYLLDDLGNQYLLRRPSENPSVRVQRDGGLTAEVFLLGEVDPQATEVSLVINDRDEDGLDDPNSLYPEFRFGPYELERSEPADDGSDDLADIAARFDGQAERRTVALTIPADELFSPGEAELELGSTFADLAKLLEFYGDDTVMIVAHTHSEGASSTNRQLSLQQAEELGDALVDAGYPEERILVDGQGESDPIVDNNTNTNRATNRRIEILITTRKGLPSR